MKGEVGFFDLKMERTCQKDKFLTFCEVRPAQDEGKVETEGEIGKLKLPGLERTWKKDTILTFWEVRPSQMDVQFEARCQVAKVMLPGMERTCQKDKILTFCEVHPAPGMPRSVKTGKLAKAGKVST